MTELKQIDYGDKDENTWKESDTATLATFGSVMDAFLAEDFNTADSLASGTKLSSLTTPAISRFGSIIFCARKARYHQPSLSAVAHMCSIPEVLRWGYKRHTR